MQGRKSGGKRVKYCVLVTADHSTPVMFGDHSHEPVPLAIAHVDHVVAALGAAAVEAIDLGALAVLNQHMTVRCSPCKEKMPVRSP